MQFTAYRVKIGGMCVVDVFSLRNLHTKTYQYRE